MPWWVTLALLALLPLLVTLIGIFIFAPWYVALMLLPERDIQQIINLSEKWQTTLVGFTAIAVGAVTALVIASQTKTHRKIEEERQKNRRMAAAALLAQDTFEACEYLKRCANYWLRFFNSSNKHTKQASLESMPRIDRKVIENISYSIENLRPVEQNLVRKLVLCLQIQIARMRSLRVSASEYLNDPVDNDFKLINFEAINAIVDAAEIYAYCGIILAMCRENVFPIKKHLQSDDVINALHVMNGEFWAGEIAEELEQRVARRAGSERGGAYPFPWT